MSNDVHDLKQKANDAKEGTRRIYPFYLIAFLQSLNVGFAVSILIGQNQIILLQFLTSHSKRAEGNPLLAHEYRLRSSANRLYWKATGGNRPVAPGLS